jgi:hypothetical protein
MTDKTYPFDKAYEEWRSAELRSYLTRRREPDGSPIEFRGRDKAWMIQKHRELDSHRDTVSR